MIPPCAAVYDEYFKRTGVVQALQDAFTGLFARDELPGARLHRPFQQICSSGKAWTEINPLMCADNPAYFLSEYLAAFHEINQTGVHASTILRKDMESCSPMVDDPMRRSCRTSAANAFALPHVIRCLTLSGVNTINHIIFHNLPDAFFSSPGVLPLPNTMAEKKLCSECLRATPSFSDACIPLGSMSFSFLAALQHLGRHMPKVESCGPFAASKVA
jgi:hypothetical protein